MQDVSSHLARMRDALGREERAQREAHVALLRLSLEDRVAYGVTWSPLTVQEATPAGRALHVRVAGPRGSVLHDGIGSGDPVVLGTPGAPDHGPVGLCVGVDGRWADLRVEAPERAVEGVVAVTRRFDATTFGRYRDALARAEGHRSPLREVLLGARPPGPVEPIGDPRVFEGLDATQRAAGRAALGAAELALIHGPPGTGKTRVIVALLQALVAEGKRPWALADSNAAVDHLAGSASQRGLRVLRLGHPARIGSEVASLSEEAWLARSPLAAALVALDRDLARARGDRRRLRVLWAEREQVARQARDHALQTCDVVAATFGTLARVAPELPRAHTAVVDEATQALEPAVWTVVPFVERLILVGDPQQLGPVVIAPHNPLGRSLLHRLIEEARLTAPMLEVQRRMHAAIARLVQPWYGPRFRPHPDVAGHRLSDLPGVIEAPLTTEPVWWIDTAGAACSEARDPATRSLFNDGEVAVIVEAARQLREAGVGAGDIGVIAPYAAQVGKLRAALPDLDVATVNAFQGREKEAILCSFVRSNDAGEVGFVADERRLVVALSRARRFLLCVGDSATLAGQPAFAGVLDAVAELGGLRSVFEPPWSDALTGWGADPSGCATRA